MYNMGMITFEWDERKNQSNFEKHGIRFEDAKSVFYDDHAIQFFDEDNSDDEDRFLLLGRSLSGRMLMVCHCERNEGKTIRIISARKETKTERKFYPR